ncbi:MAG TPA: hypothetical protein VIG88_11770 [Lysobacter sp.]
MFPLGSADVDEHALSSDLVDQLGMFGSAELSSVDEETIVRRLAPTSAGMRRIARGERQATASADVQPVNWVIAC